MSAGATKPAWARHCGLVLFTSVIPPRDGELPRREEDGGTSPWPASLATLYVLSQRGITASTYPSEDVPTWPRNTAPDTQTTDQEVNDYADV